MSTNAWNRFRYTLWAPLYDFVARFGRQRRRSIALLGLQAFAAPTAGNQAFAEYLD